MCLLFSTINKCNLEIENYFSLGEVSFYLPLQCTKIQEEQAKCFSFLYQSLTLISRAGNWILEFILLRIIQKQRQLKEQATQHSLYFNLRYTIPQRLVGQSSSPHSAEGSILFYT